MLFSSLLPHAMLLTTGLLVAITIVLWASALLPEYLTALLFFAACMALGLAPAPVVFSGFASSAFWLILSGYVLGIAIRNTGLAARLAAWLAPRLSGSYPRMIFGVIALTYALAFFMPSNMGRIALLMPIVLALADRAGLVQGRAGRTGLALAVGFGTFELSASILSANVPNLVMAGAMESTYHLHVAYLPYLLLHLPVLGVLKGIALGGCICVLFRDTLESRLDALATTPFSAAEKRLMVLLVVTLGLWLTDTLHGIAPAWVGLSAASLCLLPRVGFVSADEFGKEVNHRTALYVAAILGLAALVAHSGLGHLIGSAMLRIAPLDATAPFASYVSIVGLTTALNFAVTANGVPALFTPMAQSMASASGFTLITVLMLQVIGFSTPLLPYQASPIVVAMAMGKVSHRAALRLCLTLAAITFLVLLPLDYGWFRLLGWIG